VFRFLARNFEGEPWSLQDSHHPLDLDEGSELMSLTDIERDQGGRALGRVGSLRRHRAGCARGRQHQARGRAGPAERLISDLARLG
jgi:hypothetical protein